MYFTVFSNCIFLNKIQEVIEYFKKLQNLEFVKMLNDKLFVAKLAYLTDLFEELNVLNASMQGDKITILDVDCKMRAFKEKLQLWQNCVQDKDMSCFPRLVKVDKHGLLTGELVHSHLGRLSRKLTYYFPKIESNNFEWVINPFKTKIPAFLSLKEKEELVEIKNSKSAEIKFNSLSLEDFWITTSKVWETIGNRAINVLLQFATTYRCETGFSAMTAIKTKSRASLVHIDEEMRVSLATIRPRYEVIVANKQCQTSH